MIKDFFFIFTLKQIPKLSWSSKDELNLKPTLIFSGGNKGWIGDNPFIYLDTKKIEKLGWKPKHNLEDYMKELMGK